MQNVHNLKNKGFTLVELMITIGIASVLLVLAAPNFRAIIQNNQMVSQINELQASLNLARSEAIKRNASVTLCETKTGTGCGGHTSHWHHGWMVFVDNDSDGVVDDGETVLRVHNQLSGKKTKLIFDKTRVMYASSGITRSNSDGTFVLCDKRGTDSVRGLKIGLTGRPRLTTAEDDLECAK